MNTQYVKDDLTGDMNKRRCLRGKLDMSTRKQFIMGYCTRQYARDYLRAAFDKAVYVYVQAVCLTFNMLPRKEATVLPRYNC